MGWVLNATSEVNAQSQYPTIITICTLLSILSSAVVLARLYVRFRARGLAYDDSMSALSMVFAILYSALCIAQTRYGLGLSLALRPDANLLQYTRVNFAGRPIYQLGISFFKIALLISYLRLLSVLLKLEIRLGKKVGLVAIFGLGLFTTICSIMRYLQIDRIQHGDGNSTMLVMWGTIEFNVGNMVSSLPFLAPIFIKKARQYRSKHSDDYPAPSGRSRSRGLKSDHYKLKDMSHGKKTDAFDSTNNKSRSGSEENILQGNDGIVKSMTYTVQVDDEGGEPSSCNSVGSIRA
ncbi:hypothetical protein G7Z17_g2066 [Cylindrodendrum hubeiense]|uniref:Rhodopsin domain-containing protein n=1 Tax=Cylindrodendrum hubeiense TaxID=595255 RepID=A0A9P5HDI7_9HYPO|nr:hypothetical protein G7Z17_g2066 [Cylindrodendrum hubeiense]